MGKRRGSVRLLLLAVVCIVAASQLFVFPAVTRAQQSDNDAATQVLTLLNEWRLEQNLWPLKVNETLEAMAFEQATYLLPKLATIQDEASYHLDEQGRTPLQRAPQPPYDWPSYGRPDQIEVGENAAIGTPQFAVNFWKGSDVHRRAALSNVYREVGIAAIPYQNQYLFIADFGARPGILTALVNSTGDTLYLSDERSRYAALSSTGTQVRLFDAQGRALTSTQPWTPTITLPKGADSPIGVLYTNGDFQALDEVDLERDVAVLPGNLIVAGHPTPATQVAALPTATPMSATPAPTSTGAPIILFYNRRSITLYNNAESAIDLSGFSVGNAAGKVSAESWNKVAPIPTRAFPPGQCLQIQITSVPPDTPAVCKAVRAEVTLLAANVFWTQDTFDVKHATDVVKTCQASTGRCEVNWSPNGS